MYWQRNNLSSTMKNHSNTQKENENFPEIKLKVTEYYSLTDREFKIAVMKFSELQARQFNELRNKINEQKEYFTKEIETLRMKQAEIILELKNSINKMDNALESTGNRADHMEDRISKLEDRNLEMIQVEEKRELRSKKKKK